MYVCNEVDFIPWLTKITPINAGDKLCFEIVYRGFYMSAQFLLNLLKELRKRDKMRGLPSILSVFRNEFNKFNNTEHVC